MLRAKEQPFQVLQTADGKTTVTNHFKAHIKNQSNQSASIQIALDPENINVGQYNISTPENPVIIEAGKDKIVHLFLIDNDWKNSHDKNVKIKFNEIKKDFQILGPQNGQ